MVLNHRRRKIICRRLYILLTVGFFSSLFAFAVIQNQTHDQVLFQHPYFRYNLSSEPTEDPAQTCIIPRLHPFHPSILNYLASPRPIVCKVRIPTLTYVDQSGYLRVNQTAFSLARYVLNGGSFMQTLTCHWKSVLRGGPGGIDDNSVTYGKEMLLTEAGSPLMDDAVAVSCRDFTGLAVYENVHSNVRNISRSDVQRREHFRPNVLIFGIDSMSRQAFIRLLPKTYRYLTETLSITVFTGMNKVGDNTFPNLIALLTGKEAYGQDLPHDYERYDQWPLVWKNYSRAGYATLWAEDFPDFGLFNYLAKGFKVPPVDHYMRPFWLAVKESIALRKSSHMCFGSQPRHQLQMEYVMRFIQKYGSGSVFRIPYFAFSFLAELSHEYQARVSSADDDFEMFFRWLKENKYLDDTLLVVMSDHGHRFDPIRSTQVGRLEERLPFFGILVPSKLKMNSKLKHHIELNRVRLITPYDIHATLEDVLLNSQNVDKFGSQFDRSGYGRTLFGSIPTNRTCKDAGIPVHYCTCEPETPISVDDIKVRTAVRAVFRRINRLLRTVRDFCSELLPGSVVNAQMVRSGLKEELQDQTRIRLSVKALPSDGIFEATVEVRVADTTGRKQNSSSIRSSLPYEAKVLGDISRINKYGNQSFCIKHDILRKYCFCRPKTEKPVFRVDRTGRGF